MKAGIISQAKLRSTIGMMNVDKNICGIKQDDEVLSQINHSVHVQIQIAK